MKSTKFVVPVGHHRVTVRLRGNNYQLRMWVAKEQKTLEVSLDTGDEDVARERAVTKAIEILGMSAANKLVTGISVAQLLERFLGWVVGRKSAATIKSQKTALRAGVRFIDDVVKSDARVSDIEGKVFNQYADWRVVENQKAGKTLRHAVILQELQYIRQVFQWGAEQEPPLCGTNNVPKWGELKKDAKASSREFCTHKQWQKALQVLLDYTLKAVTPIQQHNRALLYWYMVAISASGLRTGELYQLRNKDVEFHDDGTCTVYVRAETSKVRERGERHVEVSAMSEAGPNPFVEWSKLRNQDHSKPEQFFFSAIKGGTINRVYLDTLTEVRPLFEEAGVGHVDPYHGRHMFITNKLKAHVPAIEVADICGTSTDEIEKTYRNVTTLEASKKANKKVTVHSDDGSYTVVDVEAAAIRA